MKTEYIALSPFGAAAFALSVFLLGFAWATYMAAAPASVWILPAGMGVVLLIVVRSDAREAIADGVFERNWFGLWRSRAKLINRIGPVRKQEVAKEKGLV